MSVTAHVLLAALLSLTYRKWVLVRVLSPGPSVGRAVWWSVQWIVVNNWLDLDTV